MNELSLSQEAALSQPDWDARYQNADVPWDTGTPDQHLVDFVRDHGPAAGRALEVGCGTGTNCIWLAEHGLDVLGIDLSPTAIDQARGKAGGAAGVRFENVDFFDRGGADGTFDLVFDRGCFHGFDAAADRTRFAERVAQLLTPDGVWLSLIGSTEGPKRDHGPPRRTVRDLANAIEPVLELVELRTIEFHANIPSPAKAWFCVSRHRPVPAQPSTQR